MRYNHINSVAVIAAMTVALSPAAPIMAAPAPSSATSAYVTGAALSDMFEVQAGQIASQKGQGDDVKAFGRRMVSDHTATTAMLKTALVKAGLSVLPPAQLDPDRQAMLQALQASSAADFDRIYLDQQVTAHQQALVLHSSFAREGDSAALRQVAVSIVPKIQHHLSMAQQLESKTKPASP